MRGATRNSALSCIIGQHKHGPVARVEHRLYSECYHCGSDLVRKGRRWRRARPDELPHNWKAQHQPAIGFPSPVLLMIVAVALVSAAFYIGLP